MQREICPEWYSLNSNRHTSNGLANHKCKKLVNCEFCRKPIKLYKSSRHQEKCIVLKKILNPERELKTCPQCQKVLPKGELNDHIFAHELSNQQRDPNQRSVSFRARNEPASIGTRILEIIRERNQTSNRIVNINIRGRSAPSKPGLPKPEIAQRLPVAKFDGKCEVNCTICLSLVRKGKRVKILPCFHQFHRRCIDAWLEKSSLCPICKESI